jgi:MFS family permease
MLPFARELWHIYLVAALLATGRQFTGPARLAIVVDLVPDRQLEKANALTMITRNLILLVGPACGGLLVAVWGTSSAFWVDSATFLASAVILLSHRLVYLPGETREAEDAGEREPGEEPTAGVTSPADVVAPADVTTPSGVAAPAGVRSRWLEAWRDIRQGVNLIWQQRRLRFAFIFMSATVFVTAMQTPLVVFFVKQVLARGDADLGLILSASGLGGIVGAVGGGMFTRSSQPLRTVTWLLAVDGLLLILFALGRNFPLALALFALFGAIGTLAQINLATFLQRETPQEKRGRIFGWLGAIMAPLSLASVFLGSLLADSVGVVLVLALSGLFELTVGLVGRLRLPATRAGSETPATAAPDGQPGEGLSSEGQSRNVDKPKELAGEA